MTTTLVPLIVVTLLVDVSTTLLHVPTKNVKLRNAIPLQDAHTKILFAMITILVLTTFVIPPLDNADTLQRTVMIMLLVLMTYAAVESVSTPLLPVMMAISAPMISAATPLSVEPLL